MKKRELKNVLEKQKMTPLSLVTTVSLQAGIISSVSDPVTILGRNI